MSRRKVRLEQECIPIRSCGSREVGDVAQCIAQPLIRKKLVVMPLQIRITELNQCFEFRVRSCQIVLLNQRVRKLLVRFDVIRLSADCLLKLCNGRSPISLVLEQDAEVKGRKWGRLRSLVLG